MNVTKGLLRDAVVVQTLRNSYTDPTAPFSLKQSQRFSSNRVIETHMERGVLVACFPYYSNGSSVSWTTFPYVFRCIVSLETNGTRRATFCVGLLVLSVEYNSCLVVCSLAHTHSRHALVTEHIPVLSGLVVVVLFVFSNGPLPRVPRRGCL